MQSNRISNKTQCPHCFTIYQISEDQLAQSRGNVRCGNCHERFKAQLLSDDEIKLARSKVAPNNDLFADVNEPTTRNPSADATLQEPSNVRSNLKIISTRKLILPNLRQLILRVALRILK